MISNIKNYNTNSILLINLIFGFFPICLFLGNLIININFILFICLGIYHLRSKIFTTRFYFPLKIIFLFFFIIFASTSLSFIKSLYFDGYEYANLARLIKSIVFFRYFLLLIIVYLLNKHNILNFRYFFYSAAFSSVLISLDVIYQYIFGFNIIGLKTEWVYNSSFFGEEKIAGGYIARFSFFSILFALFFLKNKTNIKFILTTTIICILSAGILFSGNRMPLVLFLFGLSFAFFFDFKLKKIILVSLVSIIILFKFIMSFDEKLKHNYLMFYDYSEKILFGGGKIDENLKKQYDEIDKKELILVRSGHKGLFLTALDTWSLNKILGNGIKSFRIDCRNIIKVKIYRLCSTHPHNYYLEILTETGIVGFLLVATVMLLFLFIIFKNFKLFKGNTMKDFILLAAMISLIMEMFPIRSSGSFFTTGNATYLMLILSIFLCYIKNFNVKILDKHI